MNGELGGSLQEKNGDDLQHNIPQRVQVAVRLRPPGPGAAGSLAPISIDGNCIQVEVAPMHSFTYDAILDSQVTQEELYLKLVLPLVKIFISGYNATIFAYGQVIFL